MAAARQVLAALVVDELVNRGDSDSDEEEQRLARIPFSIQEMSERNLFRKHAWTVVFSIMCWKF
jgi:hypothetical protein